jgi:apolipoprotein N-acyltransferase
MKFTLFYLVSFFLVAFAQPDFSSIACIVTSIIGYALLWKSLTLLKISQFKKKSQFLFALIWFASIQLVQLNWFLADRYVGSYIYIFLSLTCLVLALTFALLTRMILQLETISYIKILQISGLWTLSEWARLFFLSGFSWNPIGIALTGTLLGMQMVSLFGVFGLSFWCMLTNLCAYRLLVKQSKNILFFSSIALFPYLFGGGSWLFHRSKMEKKPSERLSVLLIQTSLYPEEKTRMMGLEEAMIPPLDQWKRIFKLIKRHAGKKIQLIVLPESAVPYGTHIPLFPIKEAERSFQKVFHSLPEVEGITGKKEYVDNAFFAHALANFFDADVVLGLDDFEMNNEQYEAYNAAFVFHPHNLQTDRYEKRVLVPLGEYIPFSFCRKFLSQFGITDSFKRGKEAKVFSSKEVKMGVSICYEETYGHLIRDNRKKGAHLLINLTNDAWYPHSRLPIVHFFHGRLRAIEGGIPLVRACNTGVTCGIDSLGRTIDQLDYESKKNSSCADSLHLYIPSYIYPTLYSKFGDGTIIFISFIVLIVPLFFKIKQFRFLQYIIHLYKKGF